MRTEHLTTRLESIVAREWSLQHSRVRVVGTSSPLALALALSQSNTKEFNDLPHLVVVPRTADAWRFVQSLQFFDSERNAVLLPHFDVSPYSGLYPKTQVLADRLRFLFEAQRAKSGSIFVAPIGSLQQKTLPFDVLAQRTIALRRDVDLPENIHELLNDWGYSAAPMVEDVGQYSVRGGILDVFSPAHEKPLRIELFGETVESIRLFSPNDQRSTKELDEAFLIPAREAIWRDDELERLVGKFRASVGDRAVEKSEYEEALRALVRKNRFEGLDFLLPFFYSGLSSPLEHFSTSLNIWWIDPIEITRHADQLLEEMRTEEAGAQRHLLLPPASALFQSFEDLPWPGDSRLVELSQIDTEEISAETEVREKVSYPSSHVLELSNLLSSQAPGSEGWLGTIRTKFQAWTDDGYSFLIGSRSQSQSERIRLLLDHLDYRCEMAKPDEQLWDSWTHRHGGGPQITIVPRLLPESLRLIEEKIIFLRDEDLLGKKTRVRETRSSEEFSKKAQRLNFGDLKPGDCVVHIQHGIGVYEGLKVMNIGGAESEFIQIAYRDKDKLYLPVYRVGQLQKYAGHGATTVLDKLGGTGWEKTKSKVKGTLRDLASELLQLYAKRAELHRPPFAIHENDFAAFEAAFPYDETEDQLHAIDDILKDLKGTKPMDRLICGDVGFGKTEVAMRAAFLAAHARKQVAVIAPTTVLTFQHLETFKKRFHGWPIEIRALNRFVSNTDAKKTLQDLKEGRVDILIGTHRLLSKDVLFKDLGLLIIDEEQKFGVAHKEKLRKMRASVDTLAMSATPIPRTLNMSLIGVRDLSLINTAPVDRLPTRTFITKWDEETIRKSVTSEISRGGQVYFIHNRIQSIYGLADELRQILPEARLKIGHGQMEEEELEKTMIQFFNHEIDILVCTTIVESGMDVPRANTMFIDQAHMMGLSQLYQLRGRVGRSKQRAYCYLILPRGKQIDKQAQERLKVIQENTALGSGIRIAQYDLELRGAGNILGEEQSGHINAVGYELYMDLLNETIASMKGEAVEDRELEPEINLRIPAMIPESYIGDLRIRLSYYKALADIRTPEELEQIESELRDQFGEIPEPALNLMGLMLIRAQCKELGVRDLSAGVKNISLIFTEKTKMKPETVIALAMRENKKYAITPDNRLNIRLNNITWPAVYEELTQLLRHI
jgi:transcription-repair coupling factor (superfamily II helicase)